MKRVNIALIGGGLMGKMHSIAYSIEPIFFGKNREFIPVKKVLCDVVASVAKRAAEQYQWEEHATDWREVVARDDIDVIDIATPPFLHAEIAIEAAKRGKQIYCEKPMGRNSVETYAMCLAAEKAGVITAVGLNKRRWPAVQFTKQLIENGDIGDILYMNFKFVIPFVLDKNVPISWRFNKELTGPGNLSDGGSHLIDMIRFFAGDFDEVVGVMETVTKKRPIPQDTKTFFETVEVGAETPMGDVTTDDFSVIIGRLKNGAIVNIQSIGICSGEGNNPGFEIYGSKGAIKWEEQYANEILLSEESAPGDRQGFRTVEMGGVHPFAEALWGGANFGISMSDCKSLAIHDFLHAAVNGEEFSPNFLDAHKVTQVIDAIVESAQTRQWVKVPD